jgi:phosphoribosyl 1,2-cyclic phosphodiesterase
MSNTQLRFWGVRGSYAAPFSSHLGVGGNTSCVEIRAGDHLLICDAGTGIIPLGNELMKQDKIREMFIILTHYHWDHVCGLPFFVPAFSPDWKISFFGPGDSPASIEENVSSQMQAPYFPVGTETWLADTNYLVQQSDGFQYGPIKIDFSNVHHPGITFGYKIQVNGKTIVYASDNECMFIEKSIKRRSNEFNEEELALFEEMIHEEHQSELNLFKDADILIHDAQYTPDDYEKKRGWGHSCYVDAITTAINANVKELYLFHHDPNYDDTSIEAIQKHSNEIIKKKGSSLVCHIAKEGMTIDL